MRTLKQIAASRANGARSKGPATPEGKLNSSRNSTRHGMFADTLVLEKENPAQFHELLNELLDEHQPSTPTQTMLVETIVAARWRQQRIWGLQKTNFDYDIASIETDSENPAVRAVLALRTNDESIRSHELLLRYEIALDRQISRALLRLQKLQDRTAKRKEESIEPPSATPSAKVAATSGANEEIIARHSVLRDSKPSAKDAARTSGTNEQIIAGHSVLRDPKPSAKDAARTSGTNEEIIARHSVLRDPKPSAKDAARTSGTNEEIIAGHSVLRDSKNEKRTQQPAETKPPATATRPNTSTPRTPEPPQDVQCPAKLPVPSALLPGDVRFKRVRS